MVVSPLHLSVSLCTVKNCELDYNLALRGRPADKNDNFSINFPLIFAFHPKSMNFHSFHFFPKNLS